MKGFSLVELMVSLLMALLLAGGLIQLLRLGTDDHLRTRARRVTTTAIDITRNELLNNLANLEPEFWEQFPIDSPIVHPIDVDLGTIKIGSPCPLDGDSDCLTFWDIKPNPRDAPIFRIAGHQFPDWVELAPEEEGSEVILSKLIEPFHGVMLFVGETSAFCLLAGNSTGDLVELVPSEYQPWTIPLDVALDAMRVLYLGEIEVTHFDLTPDPPRDHLHRSREWGLAETGWKPKRSKSFQAHISGMWFQPGNGTGSHQFYIYGYPAGARGLTTPIAVGDRTFEKEVCFADIAL